MSASVLARVDPDAARRTARGIVESRSYRPEAVPKPLEGVLRWIGDRLEPVGRLLRPIADFFSQGFGRILFVLLLVGVVITIAWWVTRVRATRAVRAERATKAVPDGARLDPDALEREAERAEAAGDLNLAIRLRFRGGLLRLDRAGAIRYRPSLTSSQVAYTLRSPDFEELAARFDAVAYGGRTADADDVSDARDRWPRVLTGARPR